MTDDDNPRTSTQGLSGEIPTRPLGHSLFDRHAGEFGCQRNRSYLPACGPVSCLCRARFRRVGATALEHTAPPNAGSPGCLICATAHLGRIRAAVEIFINSQPTDQCAVFARCVQRASVDLARIDTMHLQDKRPPASSKKDHPQEWGWRQSCRRPPIRR